MLACGEGAILSHRSAAGAWGLRPDGGSRWEVTIPAAARREPDAPVRIHRSDVRPGEVTELDGIPTTTVPRTLLDLAAVVPPHHLRRAVERAEQLELFDLAALDAVLAAHRRRPGSPALRALLEDARRHDLRRTRSDVEAAMLQLCLDHGLPRPVVNRHDDGREVDFRWPGSTLLVEADGYATHRTRRAFAADRARDRLALSEGLRVARLTLREERRQRVVRLARAFELRHVAAVELEVAGGG